MRKDSAKRPITIADIASLCNVSKSTVSRVLRTPSIVNPNTRAIVQRCLDESGYIYNAAAGDFASQKKSTIGLLIYGISDLSFRDIISSIQTMTMDYDILIGDTNFSPYVERRMLRRFIERRVSCVLMLGHCVSNEDAIREVESYGIPCLHLWSKPDCETFNYIGCDNYEAIEQAVEHLAELGHKNIGLVVGPYEHLESARQRMISFKDTLKKLNLPLRPGYVAMLESSGFSPEGGRRAMARLLELRPRVTGVVLAGDILAIGAYTAVNKAGLSVPEDISMVAIDDTEFAPHMMPSLTTVHIPGHEIGHQAGVYLSQLLHDGDTKCQIYLPTALMVRESTAPPPVSAD